MSSAGQGHETRRLEPSALVVEAALRLFVRAEKDPRARRLLIAATLLLFGALVRERRGGGERLYRATRSLFQRFGERRAASLAGALGIDRRDMGDIGRMQDFEDRAFGVQGHWTRRDPSCAVKHETSCPFAEIARDMPEICTDLVHTLEVATFRRVNPTYQLVPLTRLLAKGDSCCEFTHTIDSGVAIHDLSAQDG